jgi:hypothetical protein
MSLTPGYGETPLPDDELAALLRCLLTSPAYDAGAPMVDS